jgi:6-pyruvoyl-tetrahydropterin synthase
MLVDYVNLNFLKKFIDEELDHKTLLDINDPWTIDFINSTRPPESRIERVDSVLVPRLAPNQNSYSDPKFYNTTTPSKIPHHIDVNKGLVLLPFVPTSENICKWLHGIVSLSLSDFCDQISVSFSETPKTLATYTE